MNNLSLIDLAMEVAAWTLLSVLLLVLLYLLVREALFHFGLSDAARKTFDAEQARIDVEKMLRDAGEVGDWRRNGGA